MLLPQSHPLRFKHYRQQLLACFLMFVWRSELRRQLTWLSESGGNALTLPRERTRSVIKTEEFLRELARNTELPQDIRSYAKSLLRHYWGFHAHLDTQSTNTWTAIPR